MKVKSRLFLILLISVLLVIGINSCFQNPEVEITKFHVTVIPKGEQDTFWNAVRKGAEQFHGTKKKDKEIEIEVDWQSAPRNNNAALQIAQVETLLNPTNSTNSTNYGMVIAPLDRDTLFTSISEAHKQIPVVIMDSGLSGDIGVDYDAFVATDNYEAGQRAARELVDAMREKCDIKKECVDGQLTNAKVWILGFREGSASTNKRERGFIQVLNDEYNINKENIFYDVNNEGYSNAKQAKKASIELLNGKDKLAIPSINNYLKDDTKGIVKFPVGIFCPNETTTVGMLQALQNQNIDKKIPFVGFDLTDELYQGLQKKQIDTLIVQNAEEIGRTSVDIMIKIMDKKINEDRKLNTDSQVKTMTSIPIKVLNKINFYSDEEKKKLFELMSDKEKEKLIEKLMSDEETDNLISSYGIKIS